MKFELFNEIIDKWKSADAFHSTAMEIKISPEFFDVFYELIEKLLNTVFYSHYTKRGVDYVLYEWLYGNTSPLTVTEHNGDITKYELNTTEDVYAVMEKYYLVTENTDEETETDSSYGTKFTGDFPDYFEEMLKQGKFKEK